METLQQQPSSANTNTATSSQDTNGGSNLAATPMDGQNMQQQQMPAQMDPAQMQAYLQQQQQLMQFGGYMMPQPGQYDPSQPQMMYSYSYPQSYQQFSPNPYGVQPQQPMYGAPIPMMGTGVPGQTLAVGGSQGAAQYLGGGAGLGGTRSYPSRGGHHGGHHYQGGNHSSGGHMSKGASNLQKYKTSLCRHYETQGSCSLGDNCSFAHGQHELRSIQDPIPQDAQSKQQQAMQNLGSGGHGSYGQGGGYRGSYGGGRGTYGHSGGYQRGGHRGGFQGGYQGGASGSQSTASGSSNYKTVKCKNFDNGNCRYGNSCSYAHGDHELRQAGSGGDQNMGMAPSTPGQYVPVMPPPPTAQPHQNVSFLAAGLNQAAFPALGSGPNTQ